MNKQAIYHITDVPYVYGIDKNTLFVRIRTAKKDLKACILYYKDRYDWENEFSLVDMKLAETDGLFDYYEAEISVKENRYRYYFELKGKDEETVYLTERGFLKSLRKPKEQFCFQFAYLNPADVYKSPDWAAEGIVYQIFPDRFNNGDESNDPEGTLPWGSEVSPKSMFGGDLQGIIDKLDYIEDLGVNVLYLTPVFLSSSNHKYNTADYFKIDDTFGDIEKAKELVEKCHERGIKVLFDAVFNHSGDDFFAFKDVCEKGEKSRYKDWFCIKEFPVDRENINYITFANNIRTMPKLNTENKEVVDYLLKVAVYWIEEVHIDGWRLDVCDEVDHAFWREFRKAVKRANPNALIIGEIMHEASPWLRGEQLDGIMNYPIKHLCTDFFAKRIIKAEEFDNGLALNRVIYMKKIERNMFNLIGSHDTARFLTECGEKTERLKLAAAFQYTYIGMPYIYYGDEVGIIGGNDPECRKCMVWDEEKQNKEILNYYKKLNRIRKENKALVYGEFKSLFKNDGLIAYKRILGDEEVLVILNNDEERVNLTEENIKGSYVDLLNNDKVQIKDNICLLGNDIKILKKINI